MRVDLSLTGADGVRAGFRGLSDDLDRLNAKLDATQAKLNRLGGTSAGSQPSVSPSSSGQVSQPSVASTTSTVANVASTVAPKTAVTPPPVVPPVVNQGNASKLGGIASKVGASAVANVAGLSGSASAVAGAASAVSVAAGFAVVGIAALGMASKQAADAIREYADFQFNARGGTASAGSLAGISRAVGVDLGEAGGLAASRPGGSRQLIQELDKLRDIPDNETAARFAQNRGIEGYRAIRNLTDEQYQAAKNVPQVNEASVKMADRAFADLNISMGRLATTAQQYLIPVFAGIAHVASRIIDLANFSIESSPVYILLKLLTGDGASNPGTKLENAANKMQDAATKIHDAAYGGGIRTRSAFPAAYGWMTNAKAINSEIRNLGGL